MLAKKTSKNQITIPKKIVDSMPDVEYFDVKKEGDRIVLEPVLVDKAGAVRTKLEAMGITEEDVEDAVRWARGAQQ